MHEVSSVVSFVVAETTRYSITVTSLAHVERYSELFGKTVDEKNSDADLCF